MKHDQKDQDSRSQEQKSDELEIVTTTPGHQPAHRLPNQFTFTLSAKAWEKCKPVKSQGEYMVLQQGWTDIFYGRFSCYCDCVITFRGRVRKKALRKAKSSPYLRAKGTCKFTGCGSYSITIHSEPIPGENVTVYVRRVGRSNVQHKPGVFHKRALKFQKRKALGAELRSSGVSNVYYRKLGVTPQQKLTAGNQTQSQSKVVLRKLESEMRQAERLHPDTFQELTIIRRLLAGLDSESSVIKGFIQYECHCPFVVHLYEEAQLRTYLSRRRNEEWLVLHLDATGSIIRSEVARSKTFNYALVMAGAEPGDAPLPVAELISNSHTKVTIGHFLGSVFHHLRKLSTIDVVASAVETDFSWALIQAVLQSINHQDIVMYLRLTWKVLTKNTPWPSGVTRVHICCAHFMHLASSNLRRVCADKALGCVSQPVVVR